MKKNWNVAKVFTLLITVLFLASTLFVGCKNQEPTPEPEPTKYMVTYVTDPYGLEVEDFPTMGEVEENTTIELPTLTLEGYTFDGWYDGDTKVESPYKVTKAVTLTAKFTEIVPVPTKYMVTYVTNPEDLQVENFPTNGEVEENTTIELPVLTLEGYTFDGWYDGDTKVESPYKVTKTVTLTAKFTENVAPSLPEYPTDPENPTNPDPSDPVDPVDPVVTFSVTYTVEGIDSTLVTDLPKSGDVNKDTVLTLSPLTAPEGYVFDGWFIDDVGVSKHPVVAAVTIVAKFSVVPQVNPEPTGTTYTIPEIDPSWTNIVVYAWSEGVDAVILQATNNSGTVTFKSTVEYEKVIVVKINDSVDTNNVVIDETSEYYVWKEDDVKVGQTGNLKLDENCTYVVPVVGKYTIYLSPGANWPEANAWFIGWTYGGENTADEWIKFTDSDSDGIYEAEIYEDKKTIILLRKNPSNTDLNWDGEWARLETPINGNHLTIEGWATSHTWSTYTPE